MKSLFKALEALAESIKMHGVSRSSSGLRKIGVFVDKASKLSVSTMRIYDSQFAYETAVCHPDFNDHELIIVENYNSPEEAKRGHEKWIKIMTTEPLPEVIHDVGACKISQLLRENSKDPKLFRFERQKHER